MHGSVSSSTFTDHPLSAKYSPASKSHKFASQVLFDDSVLSNTQSPNSPSLHPASTHSYLRYSLVSNEGEKRQSKAVAGAMKALQTRIKSLESENRALREDLKSLERKLLQREVTPAKTTESELITRFQSLDATVKRAKAAESRYRSENAELSARLEQSQALVSSLQERLEKLESDYSDIQAERLSLGQRCADFESELLLTKQQLTVTSLQRMSEDSLMEEMMQRRTGVFATEVMEKTQESESSQQSRSIRCVDERPKFKGTVKRSKSLKLGTKAKQREEKKEAELELSKVLSGPSIPLVFNPSPPDDSNGPKVRVSINKRRPLR